MSVNVDLHTHTTYSDGLSKPENLVKQAAEYGLTALAVTDHDSVASLPYIKQTANDLNTDLELIPGIEINTFCHTLKQDIHILGYYIDPTHSALNAVINHHQETRLTYIDSLVSYLKNKQSLPIDMDDVLAKSHPNGSLGRPHVARTLVEKKVVPTVNEAFRKFLRSNNPDVTVRETVTPAQAVEAIHQSGGIPIIAHPGESEAVTDLIKELVDHGLLGIEAYHRRHNPTKVTYYTNLAKELGLIITGGTDFHQEAEHYPNALSRLTTPSHVLDDLRQLAKSRNSLLAAS